MTSMLLSNIMWYFIEAPRSIIVFQFSRLVFYLELADIPLRIFFYGNDVFFSKKKKFVYK